MYNMAKIMLRDKIEKEFDPKFDEYFREANNGKYLFAIVAPGTRCGADFRVQIEIYEKIKDLKSSYMQRRKQIIKSVGYVQVTKRKLKNLDIPNFLLTIGEAVQDYIKGKKNIHFEAP